MTDTLDDFAKRYQQIVRDADLGEMSHVRGCMVIKPWGYGIWEQIQQQMDSLLKQHGAQNTYFPLFIPLDYIAREAEHVSGFAKEMAVVTHKRLKANEQGELVPDGELDMPLVVRPTSETLIGESMSNWINSYRDLPMILNQWANVVRWEMRPRVFLRTVEFLWQEGHAAFASAQEAAADVEQVIQLYRQFVEDHLAIPVIVGKKPPSERFPGADTTWCIEAMMQDGKALQAGTAHDLGQHFARSCNITYLDQQGSEQFVHTTSWGVSTRLIGALIMTHADHLGMRVPPRIAPYHVVILPLVGKKLDDQAQADVLAYVQQLQQALQTLRFHDQPVRVKVEKPQQRTADLKWAWVKKGIPMVIEVGQRDQQSATVAVLDRRKVDEKPASLAFDAFVNGLTDTLTQMQQEYYQQALTYHQRKTQTQIHSLEALQHYFAQPDSGFAWAYWQGDETILEALEPQAVTIRCIPEEATVIPGKCILSGNLTTQRAVFARAY